MPGGVVKNQGQKIELQDLVEALGQFMEKRRQVALLRNHFADFEQCFELPPGLFDRSGGMFPNQGIERFLHKSEDSIRFRRVTTGAIGTSRAVRFRIQ